MTMIFSKTLYYLPSDIDILDFGKVKRSLLKITPQGFLIYRGAYQAWISVLSMLEKEGVEITDKIASAGYIDTDDIHDIQSTGLAINLNDFTCRDALIKWFIGNINKTDWLWYGDEFNYIVFSPKNNVFKNREFTPQQLSDFLSGEWIREPKQKVYTGFFATAKSSRTNKVTFVRSLKGNSPGTTVRSLKRFNVSDDVTLITDRTHLDSKLKNPILKVDNINFAAEKIIRYYRSDFSGKIVTITGSVGKTSSTLTLSRILKNKGRVLTGIYNNLIEGVYKFGLQLNIQDFAVFEVAQGALPRSADTLDSDVAVLVNLSESHMERHESLKDLALLKAQIFKSKYNSGKLRVAVINRDIPYYDEVEKIALLNNRAVITYGEHPESMFKFLGDTFNYFMFSYKGQTFRARKDSYSKHISINGLGSIAILHALNLNWLDDLELMGQWLSPPPGRGDKHNIVKYNKSFLVIDHAYNANPDSVKSALVELSTYPVESNKKRKIAVLADMLEMGDASVQLHEDVGSYFQDLNIDIVILCGELISNLRKTIKKDIKIIEFNSIEFLFESLTKLINDGDILMFKGSNGTGLRKALKEFIK